VGPIDPQVINVTVEQGGQPVAAVMNFALHPAILAGDNWLYSADFPGYMGESLSRLSGNGFIPMFFNSCCGNVNHVDYADRTQGRGFRWRSAWIPDGRCRLRIPEPRRAGGR